MKKWEKYIFWGITTAVSLIFAWGLWLTNLVWSGDKSQAVSRECVEQIKSDVKDTKQEIKDVKAEVREQSKLMEQRNTDMMKLLLEINKNTK